MFAALAKFRTIDRTTCVRYAATRPVGLVASNDNLIRPAALRARLAARWRRNPGSGRLECRWSVEPAGDASCVDPEPSDPVALRDRQCRRSPAHPSGRAGLMSKRVQNGIEPIGQGRGSRLQDQR